jgi:hypothetical protein
MKNEKYKITKQTKQIKLMLSAKYPMPKITGIEREDGGIVS